MRRLIGESLKYHNAKIHVFLFIMVLGVFCNFPVSYGDGSQVTIARGDGNYFPYEMMERGKLSGIHIESIEAVAEILNWNVTFKSLPWKKAVESLERGEVDALTYLNKSKERERYANFLDGNILSHVEYVFFTKVGVEKDIIFTGKMNQLKDYEITTNRGYYYGEKFEHANYLKKIEAISLAQQVHFVLRGKYKLGVANKVDLHFILKRMDAKKNISILDPSISKIPTYIAFTKTATNKIRAEEFAKTFLKFRNSVAFQRIIIKHGLSIPDNSNVGS